MGPETLEGCRLLATDSGLLIPASCEAGVKAMPATCNFAEWLHNPTSTSPVLGGTETYQQRYDCKLAGHAALRLQNADDAKEDPNGLPGTMCYTCNCWPIQQSQQVAYTPLFRFLGLAGMGLACSSRSAAKYC